MSLPPLRQVITADTGQFDRALGGVTSRLRRFAGPAAIGAAITGLAALTRASMNSIDELSKQARAIGIATDRLQAMSMVAREAGVSQNQLTSAIGRMQRAIVDLENGTATAVRTFERLGLTLAELDGLDPDEQFRRIAEGLNGIQDPTRRAATAMDVFGRSGRDLVNMLDDYGVKLDEAAEFQRRFGIAVSDEQAQAIERANDALGRLGDAFRGLGNMLAVTVTPVVEAFSRVILAVAGGLADILNPRLSQSERAMKSAKDAQEALNAAMGVFHQTAAPQSARAAVAAARAYRQKARDALAAAEAELALLNVEREKRQVQLENMAEEIQRMSGGAESPAHLPGSIAQEQFASRIEAAEERVRKANEKIRDSMGQSVAAIAGVTAGFGDRGTPIRTAGPGVPRPPERPIDWVPGQEDVVPGVGGAGAVRDMMDERLDALVESLRTEEEVISDWYRRGMDMLIDAREQGMITEEEFMEARERLEKEHQDALRDIRARSNQNSVRDQERFWSAIEGAARHGGDRLLKAVQAVNAARTLVNAWTAYGEVLADPAFVGRPWARLAAAAQVLSAGLGAVNAIRNVTSGGGGGGGGGAGASASASSAPTSIPVQRMVIETQGGGMIPQASLSSLIEQINEAGRRGHRIEAEFIGAR